MTQWWRSSDDGGGEKRTSFSSFAHRKGKIIFLMGIGQDITGCIDYSSLDEDTQKRMQNFVKEQRKCYKKCESHPNEPNPMTHNCI